MQGPLLAQHTTRLLLKPYTQDVIAHVQTATRHQRCIYEAGPPIHLTFGYPPTAQHLSKAAGVHQHLPSCAVGNLKNDVRQSAAQPTRQIKHGKQPAARTTPLANDECCQEITRGRVIKHDKA
jgi:hypothetical protein